MYAARKHGFTAVPVIHGIAAVVTAATCLEAPCKLLTPLCSRGGKCAYRNALFVPQYTVWLYSGNMLFRKDSNCTATESSLPTLRLLRELMKTSPATAKVAKANVLFGSEVIGA